MCSRISYDYFYGSVFFKEKKEPLYDHSVFRLAVCKSRRFARDIELTFKPYTQICGPMIS